MRDSSSLRMKGLLHVMPGAWDTHIHLFDPIVFPYKPDRLYTPGPAHFDDLARKSEATNFIIVQASVEADPQGLLYQLQKLSLTYPDRTFRGAALFGVADEREGTFWSTTNLAELHETGIRCLRVHGEFGDLGKGVLGIANDVEALLRGRIASIAHQRKWAISMQLPLQVWASLYDFFADNMDGIPIIAEHSASVTVPLSESDSLAFNTVCTMLRKGLIFVKLGALHRRANSFTSNELKEVVSKLADAGHGRLLWGSDWPHVNSHARKFAEAGFLQVDAAEELDTLRRAMSEEAFHGMLYSTPASLFGP